MRVATVAVVLLAALSLTAAATSSHLEYKEKQSPPTGNPTFEGRDVGDNIAAPFVITGLPFVEVGSTCAYLDDYDVACPYPDSDSPDVVYAYEATSDVIVTVDLCESLYDTKVYIFENVEGNVVCCNDDADCGESGYESRMENILLYGGNTYYFVVDGYDGACGTYALEIQPMDLCDVTAPVGAIFENEETCGPGYEDVYNGGCNSEPAPVFQTFHPSGDPIVVFGESGTYDDYSRDTDWYQIYVSVPNTITFSAIAEFPVQIFILDGNKPLGCDDTGMVISTVTGSPCELVSLTETVGPGFYWLWVGPSVYACQPCGLEYLARIEGYEGPSPVAAESWSTIKALYR